MSKRMVGQWRGGKGSARRNEQVDKFNNNYDAIFGKKPAEKVEHSCELISGLGLLVVYVVCLLTI